MTDDILIEDNKQIRLIRFNRLAKKNAITQAMYRRMADAIAEAEETYIRALVFLGQPGVFTSGNDIADFMDSAMTEDFSRSPTLDFLRALATCKLPMIAAVDGMAIGIGTTLLFHCDLVFITPQTSLKTPFLNLGLVPEAGSSLLAPNLMGHQRAFELLVLGEIFDAEKTKSAGIANEIVTSNTLETHALRAAEKLAALPPEALMLSRGLIKGDEGAILQRIEKEAVLFSKRLKSDEAKEAFNAFMEKRPANFSKNQAS